MYKTRRAGSVCGKKFLIGPDLEGEELRECS